MTNVKVLYRTQGFYTNPIEFVLAFANKKEKNQFRQYSSCSSGCSPLLLLPLPHLRSLPPLLRPAPPPPTGHPTQPNILLALASPSRPPSPRSPSITGGRGEPVWKWLHHCSSCRTSLRLSVLLHHR